jgi:hypothetical protein
MIYTSDLKPNPMKILSIIALLFLLPFASWGQLSNASDELEFSNPAYHVDGKVHGKGYLGSSLNLNTAYFGWNKIVVNDFQNNLRFQQSIGSWKVGLNASYSRLGTYQNGANFGFSIAKDVAINRNWSIRPAISAQVNTLAYPTLIELNSQLYDLNLGLQVRYKDWQVFGGANSIFSSRDSLYFNDTTLLIYQKPMQINFGIKKTFQIDSLQHIHATILYDNTQNYHYLNASVIYERKLHSYLLGLSVNQLNMGYGQQIADAHQLMFSFSLNQPSLLDNTYIRYGIQLNYKWQLMQKPAVHKFTGTPSF